MDKSLKISILKSKYFSKKLEYYSRLMSINSIFEFNWNGKNKFKSISEKYIPEHIYGVYLFFNSKNECIYIGKAGTVLQNGNIKSQDICKRLNNKRKKKNSKKVYEEWYSKHGILKIKVIDTWKIKKCPGFVEYDLLQSYFDEYKKLPEYNTCF